MSHKFDYPASIPVVKAASAWGIDPKYIHELVNRDVLTSDELKKFIMKASTIAYPGKSKTAVREYLTRFMLLSLKYPLIEDVKKATLQLLSRDYLKPEDENMYRVKSQKLFDSMKHDWNIVQKYVMDYFRNSKDEYIAQIPRRVFIETLQEMPAGSSFFVDGNLKNTVLGESLIICGQKLGELITMVPIGDRISREIIESNPLAKSMSQVIGSLRMRRPIADLHTHLAIGG
jgi:hypothetical protein